MGDSTGSSASSSSSSFPSAGIDIIIFDATGFANKLREAFKSIDVQLFQRAGVKEFRESDIKDWEAVSYFIISMSLWGPVGKKKKVYKDKSREDAADLSNGQWHVLVFSMKRLVQNVFPELTTNRVLWPTTVFPTKSEKEAKKA